MNAAPDVRGTATWPKALPEFTEEEQRVRDAFMARWLEYLPRRGGFVERFNHGYPVRAGAGSRRTLEIGAGLGAHIGYEDLERQEYYAVELRQELADSLGTRFPAVNTLVADCQQHLPFEDGFFDRVPRDPRSRASPRPPCRVGRGRACPRSRRTVRRSDPL